MARVYSFGMIRKRGATGTDAQVTVPHGFVFSVKMVTVFSTPSFGPLGVFFECLDDGCAFGHWHAFLDGEINVQQPLTIVFNEGETFGFRVVTPGGVGSDAADVSASGFALALP